MNENTINSAVSSPLPVLRERARVRVFSDAAWTVGGVAILVVLGIAIRTAGDAAGLKDGCWQLTGARAAASTAVLGTLISLRRGQLAVFGALYGAWLVATHANLLLVGSAALAGVGAWLVGMLLTDRGLVVRMLASALAFNVLLTASGLVKALSSDPKVTMTLWSTGLALRALATIAIVGLFAIFTLKRDRAAIER